LKQEAHSDHPLRLAKIGFNISAPHMYAMCLEHLQIEPGMSFLDIGSGCGHFTALGGWLVGEEGLSHGLEIRRDIIDFSEANLRNFTQQTGIQLNNVKFFLRNCFLPDIEERTYDRIHSGACCPASRINDLYKLLKKNGILVTPFGDKLIKAVKNDKGEITVEALASVRYGDLQIPSEAEIKAAQLAIERKRASTVVVPPNTIISELASLVNSPLLSDLTFIVENRPIYAHKFILSMRSSYFQRMLSSGMKESNASEIKIPDFSFSVFLDVLRFIYTGELLLREENVVEVLEAANFYKLERLKCLCEDLLHRIIEIDNAATLLQVADRYEASQLKSVCFEFILANYEQVTKTKSLNELDKDLLITLTTEACKRLTRAN